MRLGMRARDQKMGYTPDLKHKQRATIVTFVGSESCCFQKVVLSCADGEQGLQALQMLTKTWILRCSTLVQAVI